MTKNEEHILKSALFDPSDIQLFSVCHPFLHWCNGRIVRCECGSSRTPSFLFQVMQDDKDNCTGCVGVFVCTLVVAVSAIVILFITLS